MPEGSFADLCSYWACQPLITVRLPLWWFVGQHVQHYMATYSIYIYRTLRTLHVWCVWVCGCVCGCVGECGCGCVGEWVSVGVGVWVSG